VVKVFLFDFYFYFLLHHRIDSLCLVGFRSDMICLAISVVGRELSNRYGRQDSGETENADKIPSQCRISRDQAKVKKKKVAVKDS
jgi:hypothetical protein